MQLLTIKAIEMNRRKFRKALKRLRHLPTGKYLLMYIGNKIKQNYFKAVKSTRVAYPSTIMLELTNLCNLACTTCARQYDYGKQMDKGRMNKNEALRVIDELWPYLDSIGLTGMGETFLYDDIHEIVEYIKSKNKGIIISVSTNAVLPDFIDRVDSVLGKIDTIQVSIDGLDEVYEKIRVKSSFRTLDTNLKLLAQKAHKTGTDIMLNMVVTKENFRHMPRLVGYARDAGVRFMDFTLLNLASVTNIDRSYYRFYQSAEFLEVLSELEDAIRNTPEVNVTERNFKTENSFQKCPYPWSHFYISWDGYVPPCCVKPFPKELNFGNVVGKKAIDVFNSADYRKFRTMWYDNKAPGFCNKCHFLDIEPVGKKL